MQKSPRALATLLAFATLCAPGSSLCAQAGRPTTRTGDSTIVAGIRAEQQTLYPAYRPAVGLLTTANPLEQPGGTGTEIQGLEAHGQLTRIIASVWTPNGKYAVEYMGGPEGPPRFIFESAIFPDEAPDRPQSRNFWGQPSWERRLYLRDGRVVFTETIGDRAGAAADAETHLRRLTALRALLREARAARR